jgi:hypothetical protein
LERGIIFDRIDREKLTMRRNTMAEKKTDLQKAIDALEAAGFHVDRAYEENQKDAGNSGVSAQHYRTGAICLRIAPRDKHVSW